MKNTVTDLSLLILAAQLAACQQSSKPLEQPSCQEAGGSAKVERPQFLMNLSVGNTGWFSSPIAWDLDGDGM